MDGIGTSDGLEIVVGGPGATVDLYRAVICQRQRGCEANEQDQNRQGQTGFGQTGIPHGEPPNDFGCGLLRRVQPA